MLVGMALAAPAFGACDRRSIIDRSPDETAEILLQNSDVVGLAVIRPDRIEGTKVTQELDFVHVFKGSTGVQAMALERDGLVFFSGESLRRIPGEPGEIVLTALQITDEGGFLGECESLAFAHQPRPELLRSLFAISARTPRSDLLATP